MSTVDCEMGNNYALHHNYVHETLNSIDCSYQDSVSLLIIYSMSQNMEPSQTPKLFPNLRLARIYVYVMKSKQKILHKTVKSRK